MCATSQCASWNPRTNKRCTKEVYKSSKHCEDHYKKAHELYMNYKKLCDAAYNLDIDAKLITKSKIAHLRRCHKLLIKAYNARLVHRNYAFAPEWHDFGHDLQFQIIQDKIDKCNTELLSLTSAEDEKNSRTYESEENDVENDRDNGDEDNVDESKEIEEVKEIEEIDWDKVINGNKEIKELKKNKKIKEIKKIEQTPKYKSNRGQSNNNNKCSSDYKKAMKEMKDFAAKRKRDERETEKLIAAYIRENKTYLDRREKILTTLIELVEVLCRTNDAHINLAVHRAIKMLDFMDYFDIDTKNDKCGGDDKCGDGKCGDDNSYDKCGDDKSSGDDYKTEISSPESKVKTSTYASLIRHSIGHITLMEDVKQSYLNLRAMYDHMCFHEIAYVGRLIMSNVIKIKAIIGDISILFKVYGNAVLTMQLQLKWNSSLNRVVFSKATVGCSKRKKSQEMAMSRLKDRVLSQRLDNI